MTVNNPWQEELPFSIYRAGWILLMIFLMPSLLCELGASVALASLISTFLALGACIGNAGQLGMRKLSGRDLLAVLGAYLAIIFSLAAVSPIWEELLDSLHIEYAKNQDMVEILRSSGNVDRVLLFISICIFTPIIEEVLFRRIIYGWFYLITPENAVIITSVLFSLAHFFIAGIPGLLIMGVGFQLIYLLRKNLLTAIMLHGLVNTVASLAQLYLPESMLK